MPAQWTGKLIGQLHNAGLGISDLAAEADMCRQYVSKVLNSDKPNKTARVKLEAAFERLKEAKANAKEEI